MQPRRQIFTLVAILSASSALGFAFSIYLSATNAHGLSIQLQDIVAVVYIGLVASLVSIPAALAFGIPSFFALRALGLLRWWSICIGGALVGALLGTTSISFGVPWSASLGFMSACIAWLLLARSKLPLVKDEYQSSAL